MKILIDGREINFRGEKTVLEVARENGIYVPSLCDHPLLTPFAGCRLCLVEVKGRRGFIPSCSLKAEEGMEVVTSSPVLDEVRRQTLELILSEHPNACLVCSEKERCEEHKATIRKVGEVTGCVFCPKNNRCELQEVVARLGVKSVRFPSSYRGFEIIRQDPFFDRNYNLCILCGRCVRVCHEVRGAAAISFVFRGSRAVVGTPFNQPLLQSGCQFCGACVDVCPVGALTERARRAQLAPETETLTVCPFCSQGCLLSVEARDGQILSSVPETEKSLSLGQACVRGRFLLRDVAHSRKRLCQPLVGEDGRVREATWKEALDLAASRIFALAADEVGLFLSPQLPLEDLYAAIRFGQEVVGTENIALAAANPALAELMLFQGRENLSLPLNYRPEDVRRAKIILIIGGDITSLQPVLWVEVFKAIRQGARLITLDSLPRPIDRHAALSLKASPEAWPAILGYWLKRSVEEKKETEGETLPGWDDFLVSLAAASRSLEANFRLEEDWEKAWKLIKEKEEDDPVLILFGPGLTPEGARPIMPYLLNLGLLLRAKVIPFGFESNLRGALELARRLRVKLKSPFELADIINQGKIRAVLSIGPLPFLPEKKPDFLVQVDPYLEEIKALTQVMLPASTSLERPGMFVAGSGLIQAFAAAIKPGGESRPDWEVLLELAKLRGKAWLEAADKHDLRRQMVSVFPELEALLAQEGSLPKDKEATIASAWLEEPEIKLRLIPLPAITAAVFRRPAEEWQLLADLSLDFYRSLPLATENRDLHQFQPLRRILIDAAEAKELGLKDGETISLKNAGKKLIGRVRVKSGLPRRTVVINLILDGLPGYSPYSFLASYFGAGLAGSLTRETLTLERGN